MFYVRHTVSAFLVGLISIAFAHAQQVPTIVDVSSPLETISTEFEMADGPCWDGSSLTIPDVKGQQLYRYISKQEEMQTLMPDSGRISATFFNHGRTFLSDNPGGQIVFLDGRNKVAIANFESLSRGNEKKPYRPNDMVVDNEGGIYVTFTPQGEVVYVNPNGELTVAVRGIDTPNGITMSPDGSTLYVSSFVPKTIWAYDITGPGKTSGGRQIAAMDDGPDRGADGMTIDRAGNVYCAGPTDIWVWSPSGKLIDKIACPTKPINCTFGDSDMRSLYITGPGALYRQRMRISGRSPTPASLDLRPVAKNQPEQNASLPETKIPGDLNAQLDVVYAQYGDRKLLVDIMAPKTASPRNKLPCLVIVHGGGWHNGDKTKFRALTTKMASRGYVVAAIEYRLADEAAFPAAMHDCTAAVRFLRANAERYHIQANKIGAIGGSAGAHLTGLMAAGGGNPQLQGDGGNPDQSARIQASIVMAGPMEMLTGSVAERSRSGKGFSNSNSWLRGTVDDKPELYRLADAYAQIDEETCPILFMVGEHDHPQRNQQSRDKLKSLGIETGIKVYKDGKHGCWNRLPWLDQMVVDMDAFMKKHLK
jgi:gluconolactonase